MNLRNDLFAVYKGKEYRLAISKDDDLRLVSSDVADLKAGFFERSPGLYILNVKKEDLESYYDIGTMARYKGHDFGVRMVTEGQVLIFCGGDSRLAKELGLDVADKGVYEKWVKEEDLEKVWEEKSQLDL